MFHGAELRVLESGIKVAPGLMETVGIYDKSRCWGVLVSEKIIGDPGGVNSYIDEDQIDPVRGEWNYHLFISPIHPESWASLLRMELKLKDERWAMKRAADVLVESEANILFAECAYSGFNHATWNLIAEYLPEREGSEKLRKDLLKYYNDEGTIDDIGGYERERDEIAYKVYRKMLTRAYHLKKKIIDNHLAMEANRLGGEDLGFLHKNDELNKYDALMKSSEANGDVGISSDDRNEFSDFYRAQSFERVRVQLLPNLERAWLKGINSQNPLKFVYDARHTKLVPNDLEIYQRRLKAFGSPTMALASFDTRENYIRLRVFEKKNVQESIVDVRITYEANLAKSRRKQENSVAPRSTIVNDEIGEDAPQTRDAVDKGTAILARESGATGQGRIPSSSKGLLSDVCKGLAENHVNLIQLTELTRESHPDMEIGTIKLVGRLENLAWKRPEVIIERIRSYLGGLRNSEVHVSDAHVGIHRIRTLFLSTHFEWERFADIEKMVEKCAIQYGFTKVVLPQTHTDNATDHVVEELGDCDAMLQVVSSRSGSDDGDLSWLIFEYGLSRGRAMPCIRMVDLSRTDDGVASWAKKLRVDRDRYVRTFDSRWDAKKLEDAFATAISELADILDVQYRRI